ncbi:hypothetical protein CYMTET_46092 [Cymbomonas tetramitiformis]|uniref:Uncharacterized protein n=1 Tax=Cymbomonas tetramitiformis TaxID=36881 RepID=A0AAE0BYN7_9CHLO|nr:hypothetical protein CYMTET_46092 [Cymbomonas tetramitiformis]
MTPFATPPREPGTAPLAADDIKRDPALKAILDKITVLELFIRGGCKGPLTPAMKKAAMGPRGGLNGYRIGAAKEGRPPAGFDKAEMRAVPHCKRRAYNGDGEKYHPWRDCPHGGAQEKYAGTAVAFCYPLDGEDMQAMALAQHGVAEHAPASAAAVAVGVRCGAALDGPAFGYGGSTGGGTYGVATIAPALPVERTPWPRTIECVAPHEITHHGLTAQQEAGFQVAAGAFTASQISVPSAAGQHVAQTARRPAVECGVPPFGFGMPAIGAVAVLSLFCISFAEVM